MVDKEPKSQANPKRASGSRARRLDPSQPLALAAHELFAHKLVEFPCARDAAVAANLNPNSASAIRRRHGIEERVAYLLEQKARAMVPVPAFTRDVRKTIVAAIALDEKSTRKERLQAIVVYENLYGDSEQSESQTLSLAQYVALYAPEGERDAKTIECEVIENGR